MTDPINLTELRAETERVPPGYDALCEIHRDDLLALIDVAEAAHEYADNMAKIAHDWRMDWSDFDGRILRDQESDAGGHLRAALARFTRNDT